MNPLDNLTVCITTFRRPEFLDRALKSVRAAGIRRVVVAAMEPSVETLLVIESHRAGWLSFDVASVADDLGCNDTWMLAAYSARTKRIIILHDDDTLNPEFGSTYTRIISPILDREPCFATWRADLLFMDGTHKPTDFWTGPTRVTFSRELLRVLSKRNRLSLSPVISVLDRETVIHACKEASENLIAEGCYHHPGMLLGTELVVYIRHVQKFPRWLYVDQVLSHYGSHEGSGTVAAEKMGHMAILTRGYDMAREQAEKPKPVVRPRILFTFSGTQTPDAEEIERDAVARRTWDFHFSHGLFLEFPLPMDFSTRTSLELGDTRQTFYIRDIFDWGIVHAMPEDIVVFCNRDIGLTVRAGQRLIEGVARGRGVTCCPRRRIDPKPGRMYESLHGGLPDGGFDVFAVTPKWWGENRLKMPDMLIGREAWDTVFRELAEEWADNKTQTQTVTGLPSQWNHSRAYTDHVCWHKNHHSFWIKERLTSAGQKYNRGLARNFFAARNNQELVKALS